MAVKRMLVTLLTLVLFATATVPAFVLKDGRSRFGREKRNSAAVSSVATAGTTVSK